MWAYWKNGGFKFLKNPTGLAQNPLRGIIGGLGGSSGEKSYKVSAAYYFQQDEAIKSFFPFILHCNADLTPNLDSDRAF